MLSTKTLKRYIKKCDDIMIPPVDIGSTKNLIEEIVTVLQNDIEGIAYNLDLYYGYLDEQKNNYLSDVNLLRARLQKELDALEENDEDFREVGNKIFISHATADKEYVSAIVELIESLGIPEDKIICSSIPPYSIPLDNNIYDWLASEFTHYNLHMLFVLSKSYYDSYACLNEMGAAWALKHRWTCILLPGFGFEDIGGCIDSSQVSIKLDDTDTETLKYRLGELKDSIIAEFELDVISPSLWERKRNKFLERTKEISEDYIDDLESDRASDTLQANNGLEKDAAVLLVFAANTGGCIMISPNLSKDGPDFCINNFILNRNDSARESAHWDGIVSELENKRFIKSVGSLRDQFMVTEQGYKVADQIKDELNIDITKKPSEYYETTTG